MLPKLLGSITTARASETGLPAPSRSASVAQHSRMLNSQPNIFAHANPAIAGETVGAIQGTAHARCGESVLARTPRAESEFPLVSRSALSRRSHGYEGRGAWSP